MRIRLLIVLSFVALAPLAAQESPNSLHLEVFGKSTITATLAYERQLTGRFALGAAAGINNISRVDFIVDEQSYTGTDVAVPMSLYGVVRIIGDKHRLYGHFGSAFYTEFSLHPLRPGAEFNAVPFVGLGYEYRGDSFIFRVPGYVAYLGDSSGIFSEIMPWFGVSVGMFL